MKNKEIKLEILAVDFVGSLYLDSGDCVITKALGRAGLSGYEDAGIEIHDSNGNSIIVRGNKTYDKLVELVVGMYSHTEGREMTTDDGIVPPIEPRDFKHTLILD